MAHKASNSRVGDIGEKASRNDFEQRLMDAEDDMSYSDVSLLMPVEPRSTCGEVCNLIKVRTIFIWSSLNLFLIFNTPQLTVPIFVAMVAWVAMKTTDTALLGHSGHNVTSGTESLEASSYSDLWTQSTGVFITGRVLGVFASQAFGAGNKKLVGVWLQVSYFVLTLIALPVAGLWSI